MIEVTQDTYILKFNREELVDMLGLLGFINSSKCGQGCNLAKICAQLDSLLDPSDEEITKAYSKIKFHNDESGKEIDAYVEIRIGEDT